MARILTNTSSVQSVTLLDFFGKIVAPSESFDGLAFGEAALRESTSIQLALLQNKLVLNDGFSDFVGQAAVDLIRGYATQVTKDGKQISTSSDRPKDYYRCFAGRGDDVTSVPKKIGLGPFVHLIAQPGGSASVDIAFADDVYIRDGEVLYLEAGFDSHLTCDVICPANAPFPSPTKTGNWDLTSQGLVANTTNSGNFMSVPVQVTLFRFINSMHLIGSGKNLVSSPEPFLLNAPYFLRFSISADAELTSPLKAAVTMGLFRKKTL